VNPQDNLSNHEFGSHEEKVIISLAFENPEFFITVMPYLEESYFDQKICKFVFAIIKHHYVKHSVIISRNLATDISKRALTADDPHEEILDLINKPVDPRELPIVMETLVDWAKKKVYGKLYTEEAIDAHIRGDHSLVEKVVEEAGRVNEFKSNFFFFYKSYDSLFVKENEQKLTTGFSRLDIFLNNGGPTRGEVVCVMAPTGVGKSLFLVNAGTASILNGLNVLHVTCEMTKEKTAQRYLGCMTDEWIESRFIPEVQQRMKLKLEKKRETYDSQLIIVEYPPNDVTVDVIHMNIDVLRRMYGINVDVVIVDYLELLLSRQNLHDDKEYSVQKRVGTELCRLAKKEKVLVFTAMQTNRGSGDKSQGKTGDDVIELNRVSESWGKTMALDYIISINQNRSEYDEGKDAKSQEEKEKEDELSIMNAKCRFYIAKNRNGPKFETIDAKINYKTMKMVQYNW